MDDVLWNLNDVTLRGDGVPRLDRLTVDIRSGVTAIIGYSGAGKTTLLNLLAGMDQPDSGQIRSHFSTESCRPPFRLPLFWVPQDGGLWPHFTARRQITAALGASRRPSEADVSAAAPKTANQSGSNGNQTPQPTDSADKILSDFDLLERQAALPAELSKGEQSRLSVARCLAGCPAVMLMDEPLAHTDPVRRPQYWKLVREYREAVGSSLIFTTHEPAAVIREASRVICLKQGKMIYSGSTLELYRSPPTVEAARFLGPVTSMSAEECATWLKQTEFPDNGLILRPEMLELRPDTDGSFEILSFHFSGSYAETRVRHHSSAAEKVIVHRPIGRAFSPGQNVTMSVRQW